MKEEIGVLKKAVEALISKVDMDMGLGLGHGQANVLLGPTKERPRLDWAG